MFTVSKLEPDVTDEDTAAGGSFNNSKLTLDIKDELNTAGGWGTSATFTV